MTVTTPNEATRAIRAPEPAPAGLVPVLGVGATVLLTISCITPASSLFIVVPELLRSQGSGVVLTLLAGVLVSVAVGACYAELGTRTPSSGGEYAMVTHTLGRYAGFLTFALTASLLIVIPPIIALGTADYLSSIVTLPRAATGAAVMALATFTGILNIRANAIVTSCFLGLETIAASVVAFLGFSHAQRSPAALVTDVGIHAGSTMKPFPLGVLVSGLAVAMFVVNGFGTASYLAEEIHQPRRNVARAIFWSLGLAAVAIIVPTAATVVGAGSLSELSVKTFPEFVQEWAGPRVAAAVSVGVAIAILNAVIVMVVQNGRVIYSSGRDQAWPTPVNRALSTLHARFGSPWIATLGISLPGVVLAYSVDIERLLGMTSVIVSLVYILLALAALRVRRIPGAGVGWRMPLWPLAPVVTLAAVCYALLGSGRGDLLITLAVCAVATVYYLVYLRPRQDTRFVVEAFAHEEDAA